MKNRLRRYDINRSMSRYGDKNIKYRECQYDAA